MAGTLKNVFNDEGDLARMKRPFETPMIDRAMAQHKNAQFQHDLRQKPPVFMTTTDEMLRNGQKTWVEQMCESQPQPESLLSTIERSLKDIYEWACEKQRDNQGLLYDLNTAISAVERCGVKIKDGK
jgi:hypothetical protein